MPKQKRTTRKRASAMRRKKAKAAKELADAGDTPANEAADSQGVTALTKSGAHTPTEAQAAAKQKKARHSSAKRTGARRWRGRSASTKKTAKRKRGAAQKRRAEPAAKAVAPEASPLPGLKPVSPAAELVRDNDTIVIRFPEVAPSAKVAPASVRSKEETTEAPASVLSEAGRDEAAMEPPIDWESAEEPPVPAESESTAETAALVANHFEPDGAVPEAVQPALRAAEPATPPEKTDESPQSPAGGASTGPARAKRRRRRRKRDPRLAHEVETRADKQAKTEQQRKRPEVAGIPADEKSAHRSRRPRRSRKPEAAAEVPAEDTPSAEVSKDLVPSVEKEMVINVVPREECRIAVMEGGKLQEIYLERASAENYVGNIYKGIVTNVEPSIQAAFVDFGTGKNGFLHVSDLHPRYFPNGERATENVGRKTPRRSRPPIQRCLRRGQGLLVQITKEGIGTKGPTLTTYLSIPGRYLVMMPGMRQLGVSRKIEDDEARRKLRKQLLELNLPEDIGFIARTAALDRTKRELQSDLNYLTRLWKAVQRRIKDRKAPAELYTESDLVIRTIRDVYTSDITRIVVDEGEVAKRAHEFLSIFSPRSRDSVVVYDDPEPIFHRYGIEAELERLHSRHVPLKSGGSLVIDQTEALVAIDVNSGRFRTEDDAETTAYKINLEAADEIPRQLRLRDLGGVVICDLIDMRQEKHKREIERRLARNLKEHKERAKILRTSAFGIIELTRQRQRASLTRSVYQDCQHCRGTGLVKTPESVVLDVMRRIQLAVTRDNIRSVEVSVSPPVAELLQNRKRSRLYQLEAKNQRAISVRAEPTFSLDQIAIQCYDARGRAVSQP